MNFYRNLRIRYKLGIGFFAVLLVFNLTVAAYINTIEQLVQNTFVQLEFLHSLARQLPNTIQKDSTVKKKFALLDNFTVRTLVGEVAFNDKDFRFKVIQQTNWLVTAAIVVSIVSQLWISRSVTKPVITLQDAAEDIAGGNFTRQLEVHSTDEIGKLADTFNTMTQSIRTLLREVSEESARAQAAEQEARRVSEEIEAQREYLSASVRHLLAEMERLAKGDLTVSATIANAEDDIGKLFIGFNRTVQTIHTMMLNVAESVETASQAGDTILSGTKKMEEGIQAQSSQTAGVATAMEEMTATIAENTHHASVAAREASCTSGDAEQSRAIMQEATNGMNRIAETVLASVATIRELERSSEEIGEIVGVIAEIADQTNLLALNAAIEAARAGDQGRGFAVVADEVRKLAERTQQATKQISSTIQRIQNETANAVHAMTGGTYEVERGKESIARTAEALQRMITQTSAVSDIISQLATASEEQISTSEEIAQNIDAINTVAVEFAQVTLSIGKISVELNDRMGSLREAISQFRV